MCKGFEPIGGCGYIVAIGGQVGKNEQTALGVERFDGYVAKYLGDGIVVYFGYPNSHEDDVERAIRAGLELIEAVKDIDDPYVRNSTTAFLKKDSDAK